MRAPDWFAESVIARLSASFPSWPCHEGTIQVFWDCLADLPRLDIERAVVAYCAQETAWPVVAKIRTLAKASTDDDKITASEAWEEMYDHRHAHTRNPKWSSEAVERAAEAVRWNDPNWRSEQIPTIRAQFERYYNAIEKKTEKWAAFEEGDKLLQLTGMVNPLERLYGKGYKDPEEDPPKEKDPDNDPDDYHEAEAPW